MLESLLNIDNLITLLMLIFLQVVLGFDNLLYISIESKRVPLDQQSRVRRLGIVMAIGLRIVLLFVILAAIEHLKVPFFSLNLPGIATGQFNVHSVIVLLGGAFIIYTAIKEIYHMIGADIQHEHDSAGPMRSAGQAIFMIVLMNLVFSFDSILSAVALTDVFWIMATAIVISGILMILLADHVAEFLQKNRMYEVLGLFILFVVGIMLVTEGGHLAHIQLLGQPVEAMQKTTFYFVIIMLVVVDVVQTQYQRRILAQAEHQKKRDHA